MAKITYQGFSKKGRKSSNKATKVGSGKRVSKVTSSKRISRSAVTGRFVTRPAKTGSLKTRTVEKAIRKVSCGGSKVKKSRSSQTSKVRA